jgi:stage II sporulation protein E
MVEEAIWAFSRMELNEAWYKRLQENRMVIAGQLDAMSLAMQDWGKGKKNLDEESKLVLAKIGFELRERGLVAEYVHIYEDEEHRQCITARVASKWGGGIPSKNYRKALERATGLALRLQREARSILTRDPVVITAYEDTCFDVISAVASEAKEGASISGDNVSMYTLEEGRYNICLSDGMGSGPAASKESDMVVDLMEKFMEAGFASDTAIRIMNSAMVLKGEDESYSTLDFGVIDLYTGELELTKIGAAASFVRHRQEVSCLFSPSLPAGADVSCVGEPIRRKLTNGDFLVMVTDGVLEYLHLKNPEEKLSEMISEIKTDNAGVLARTLMERVMLFTGGHAMDDMTIVVTGIWEK